ncbi:hypothetical protein D910_04467 [Dendroctonus ponderosae]
MLIKVKRFYAPASHQSAENLHRESMFNTRNNTALLSLSDNFSTSSKDGNETESFSILYSWQGMNLYESDEPLTLTTLFLMDLNGIVAFELAHCHRDGQLLKNVFESLPQKQRKNHLPGLRYLHRTIHSDSNFNLVLHPFEDSGKLFRLKPAIKHHNRLDVGFLQHVEEPHQECFTQMRRSPENLHPSNPGSHSPHWWLHVVDQPIDFGLLKIVQVLRWRLVLQEVDAGKGKPSFGW